MKDTRRYKIAAWSLCLVLCLAFISACERYPAEYGKRLKYKTSSLFYTPAVTEQEARKLGDYLLKNDFFHESSPGSTQLTREGDVYQFRAVVRKDVVEDREYLESVGLLAAMISRDVFESKDVEIHLCDKNFKTVQTVGFKIKETNE